jgi:hypothetical protein
VASKDVPGNEDERRRYIQKSIWDFVDAPCAMILKIDDEEREPPIMLTKDDLDSLLWKNRDEWDRLVLHFIDGNGVPASHGPVEIDRSEFFHNNHFLL